jgi:hypothetical protein
MTTVAIEDIPVAQELTDDAAKKIVGGRIKLKEPLETPVIPPSGGGGVWNPYDGNLLNHPEDDG